MLRVALAKIRPLVFTLKTKSKTLTTPRRLIHQTSRAKNQPNAAEGFTAKESAGSALEYVDKYFNFKVLSIIAAAMGFTYFYIAHFAKYDLEVEELNMVNIPGYEESMGRDVPGYTETIEMLRQKRANGQWVYTDLLK